MAITEDKILVSQFLEGNEASFNKLASKYQERIYWHARRMLGNHNDADEVTQEVLLVMYKKLASFKFDSALYTWIYKITSTRSLNYIKKMKAKKYLFFLGEDKFDNDIAADNDIIKNTEDKEKIESVQNVLNQLPTRQREVFILRNFEDLSYEDISKITGKSVGGLKANYFHALKKVKELLDE